MMDRPELKARSRDSMSWASPSPVLVSFIYVLIPLGVVLLAALGMALSSLLLGELSELGTWAFSVALSLLTAAFQAGYVGYCLDASRNLPAGIGTLFAQLNRPGRFIGLTLLLNLATGLPMGIGTLLFMIPFVGWVFSLAAAFASIYISLGFAMVYFVAVDRPDLSVTQCMGMSWELMQGRRWEYFVLGLSFIPWALLCIFVIPALWVGPYMMVTYANYYNLITGQLRRENVPYGAPPAAPPYEDYMR